MNPTETAASMRGTSGNPIWIGGRILDGNDGEAQNDF